MPTCTQCGSEYGAETPSGYCPACDQKVERPEQHEAAPQVSHRELAAGMPVTVAIIAVNCAVLLLMAFRHVSLMSPTSEQLLRFGANHGPLTLDGQWWRLLTNTFLHIGLAHLAVNMWSLWNLGALAERLYGRWLYLFIYLFSGVAGSIASIAWHPGVTSAGASGAIFGLAGALIVTFRWGDLPIPRRVLKPVLTTLVVFTLANVLFGLWTQFVDNGAHLGGLAAGLVLGWLTIQPRLRGEHAGRSRLLMAASCALVLAGLWTLVVKADGWVVHVARADKAREARKFDVAINELKIAANAKPKEAALQLLLARAYLETGQVVPAKAKLLRTVELNPKLAEGWTELGLVLLGQNQISDGYNALAKAAALQPNSAQAQSQLAMAAAAMGRPQEAVGIYKKIIAMQPKSPDAYKQLGVLYLRMRDYDNALATFQQMTQIAPSNFEAQLGLAAAYKAKGMESEARAALDKAMKLRPQIPAPAPGQPGDQAAPAGPPASNPPAQPK